MSDLIPLYREYDTVRLRTSLPEHNLYAGVLGAVLLVYIDNPPHYEVEFVDDKGETISIVTVSEDVLEIVSSATNYSALES